MYRKKSREGVELMYLASLLLSLQGIRSSYQEDYQMLNVTTSRLAAPNEWGVRVCSFRRSQPDGGEDRLGE